MPASINHLYQHFKLYGLRHKALYVGSLMLFFWAVFDGLISFISPLVIVGVGISETMMGLIIGTSSLAGMVFDFILCRVLKNTNFRRIYLLLFAVCLIQPLVLWQAKTVWLYLLAMALWGLYYDLYNIGNFDFIVRISKKEEHASSFGVLRVFNSLGYLLAPLIAGLIIIDEYVSFQAFLLAWMFLGLAIIFYLLLLFTMRGKNHFAVEGECRQPINFFAEFYLWKKIGNYILPVLALTLMLNIIDSFFWTIGPIFSQSLGRLGGFGSLFMVGYLLPALFAGWFVGSVTGKFGQKKTAFLSLLAGSAILASLGLAHSPWLTVLISFVASFFIALSYPAINGAYADYITEGPEIEKEIESMEDSFTNLGYIIGPMLAGLAAQHLGHALTFSALGIAGVITALVLLKVTPRQIKIKVKAG